MHDFFCKYGTKLKNFALNWDIVETDQTDLASPRLTSPHLTSPYHPLFYLTLLCLTSPNLTSPHLCTVLYCNSLWTQHVTHYINIIQKGMVTFTYLTFCFFSLNYLGQPNLFLTRMDYWDPHAYENKIQKSFVKQLPQCFYIQKNPQNSPKLIMKDTTLKLS